MSIWKQIKIGEIGDVIGGGTPSTNNDLYYGEDIPWITPRDLSGYQSMYISKGARGITKLGLMNSSARILPKGTVLFSSRAPIGYVAIAENEVTTNQGFKSIVCDEKIANNKFIYYSLLFNKEKIESVASGSTFKEISGNVLKNLEILLPDIKAQEEIAEILSSLDDKIELNRKINANLEKMASALFKKWFVDFEFPDKDGKPYKTSGGQMVISELGEIPNSWSILSLKDFFPIITGKKDANVATQHGQYPFFSCSQGVLHTDEYSFDSSSILLSGNGDFNVKWYEGKFDAYQRTYVLTPKNKLFLGFLFYAIKYFLDDITAGHRGSVIRFITKGMIEDFKIAVPSDLVLKNMATFFYENNQTIDFHKREIDSLSQIRDSLLPRLMNGKIRVKI